MRFAGFGKGLAERFSVAFLVKGALVSWSRGCRRWRLAFPGGPGKAGVFEDPAYCGRQSPHARCLSSGQAAGREFRSGFLSVCALLSQKQSLCFIVKLVTSEEALE